MTFNTSSEKYPKQTLGWIEGVDILFKSKHGSCDYSNLDMFLFFNSLKENNIDILSAIRALLMETLEKMPPETILDNIVKRVDLLRTSGIKNKKDPLSLLQSIDMNSNGGLYFTFLKMLLEKDENISKFITPHSEDIEKYLRQRGTSYGGGGFSAGIKENYPYGRINNEGNQRFSGTLAEEDLHPDISNISPFVSLSFGNITDRSSTPPRPSIGIESLESNKRLHSPTNIGMSVSSEIITSPIEIRFTL